MKLLPALLIAFLFFNIGYAQPANDNIGISKAMYIPFEKKAVCRLGSTIIPVKVFQYGNSKDIICINLHDNEETCVEGA